MWPDDPITESPASGGRAPRIDLRYPPLHESLYAARGIFYGLLFGAELWMALAVLIAFLI